MQFGQRYMKKKIDTWISFFAVIHVIQIVAHRKKLVGKPLKDSLRFTLCLGTGLKSEAKMFS